MSKQKSYFTSAEIAHVFVHQNAPEGRCPGSMTFNGSTFYSYATPIGKLVKNKAGQQAIVINASGYSLTTTRHQTKLKSAANHLRAFYVSGLGRGEYNGLPGDGESLVAHYLAEFEKPNHQEESKFAYVRAQGLLERRRYLEQAISAAEFFGLPVTKLRSVREKSMPERDAAMAILAEREEKKKASKFKREAREGAVRGAKAWLSETNSTSTGGGDYLRTVGGDYLRLLDHDPELLARVEAKNGLIYKEALDAWKRGESPLIAGAHGAIFYILPVALRREEDQIVTTLGARFPVDHAKRAYLTLKKLRERHEKFQANGHTIPVGGYRIERMDEAGTVVAGCHKVLWSEVEDLARREGWNRRVTLAPDEGEETPDEVKDAIERLHDAGFFKT